MNETQEKLFDEMRKDLRYIREAFAGSEARREDLDRRMTEVVTHSEGIQDHLGDQDTKLDTLTHDLGVHLKAHASLKRVKSVMWTAAVTMFTGALVLYLAILANHQTQKQLAQTDAQADTTLAAVAVMAVVCNPTFGNTTDHSPERGLLTITCPQAVTRVETRLRGIFFHEGIP